MSETQSVERLRELIKHPGWEDYLDIIEGEMQFYFRELFALEPTKLESYYQFIALKAKIEALRDNTYFVERQISGQTDEVDSSYNKRFMSILKRLFSRRP